MRESLLAASMASITSLSKVSGAGPPEAWPNARRTRIARQLFDQLALGRDHKRGGPRHDRNGGMQRGENEAENHQQ